MLLEIKMRMTVDCPSNGKHDRNLYEVIDSLIFFTIILLGCGMKIKSDPSHCTNLFWCDGMEKHCLIRKHVLFPETSIVFFIIMIIRQTSEIFGPQELVTCLGPD